MENHRQGCKKLISHKMGMTVNEIAQRLREQWLGGKGEITQLPGPASDATKKFYSTHKGTDIGIEAGTPVLAPSNLEILGEVADNTGYGNRLAAYDPKTDMTYLLSHLSKYGDIKSGSVPQGTTLAYTGGTPGTAGAGNTTGSHLDIETYKGRYMPNAGVSAPATTNYNMGDYAKRMMSLAQQQYGNKVVGVASSPEQLQKYLKTGRKIVKLS